MLRLPVKLWATSKGLAQPRLSAAPWLILCLGDSYFLLRAARLFESREKTPRKFMARCGALPVSNAPLTPVEIENTVHARRRRLKKESKNV